ncbi:MAG: hypothetical protein R3D00_22025 [Bacteroidia bacterium]
MERDTKLTRQELSVFKDLTFMPLKAKVWEKIEALLNQLRRQLSQCLLTSTWDFSKTLFPSEGKIARGENYHTYAYRVLDHPAIFDRDHFFTFRTVILWGRPVGFHLILSGRYKDQFQPIFLAAANSFSDDFLISAQSDPWIWEPQSDQQFRVSATTEDQLKTILSARAFLKLSVYLPLEAYEQIPSQGVAVWQQIEKIFSAGK